MKLNYNVPELFDLDRVYTYEELVNQVFYLESKYGTLFKIIMEPTMDYLSGEIKEAVEECVTEFASLYHPEEQQYYIKLAPKDDLDFFNFCLMHELGHTYHDHPNDQEKIKAREDGDDEKLYYFQSEADDFALIHTKSSVEKAKEFLDEMKSAGIEFCKIKFPDKDLAYAIECLDKEIATRKQLLAA